MQKFFLLFLKRQDNTYFLIHFHFLFHILIFYFIFSISPKFTSKFMWNRHLIQCCIIDFFSFFLKRSFSVNKSQVLYINLKVNANYWSINKLSYICNIIEKKRNKKLPLPFLSKHGRLGHSVYPAIGYN